MTTTTTTEAVTRPIIFSGPMIRALLAGTKAQTRRIVKPQPDPESWPGPIRCERYYPSVVDRSGEIVPGAEVFGFASEDEGWACPFGGPGSRLWVREAATVFDIFGERRVCKSVRLTYSADSRMSEFIPWPERLKFTPVIGKAVPRGVFREASRLTLEITDVRVERLGNISEEDARAEGIRKEYLPLDPDNFHPPGSYGYVPGIDPEETIQHTRREAYAVLWNHIHGPGSWEQSPWVWVLSFHRVEAPRA